MKILKLLAYSLALRILLLWSLGYAITNIEQVERNQTHAILQCKTDLQQIIWKIRKIGRTRRFEAKRYERNGNFVTATTRILVNETINVTCIGKTRFNSERDRLTLYPYEVTTDSPTFVTTVATDTDDSVSTSIATSPTSPTVYDDGNVTVVVPTPPTDQQDGYISIPVVVGIVAAVLCFLAAVTVVVAVLCCYMQRRKPTVTVTVHNQQPTHHNPDAGRPQSQRQPDALTRVCIRAQVDESDSHKEKSTQKLKEPQVQSNSQKEDYATPCDLGPPPMSQPSLKDLQPSRAPESNQCEDDEHKTTNLDQLKGDEQSVETPVTVVTSRPPPRRILPHPSLQREYGDKDVPIGQLQVQLFSGEQNPQEIGIVLEEPVETTFSGSSA